MNSHRSHGGIVQRMYGETASFGLTSCGGFAIISRYPFFSNMKLTRFFVLALGLSLGGVFSAEAENDYTNVTWANGLFINDAGEIEGWYDANKSDADNKGLSEDEYGPDDSMCYAASAANLVAWWQNGIYGQSLTSSAPKALDDIWGVYKNNNQDYAEGGEALSAINWWISGVYSPDLENESDLARYYESAEELGPLSIPPLTLPRTDGFYYDDYGLTQEDLGNFLTSNVWEYGEAFNVDFRALFNNDAGISLLICADGVEDAHVITMWGARYDDNGELISIWVTDSDDYYIDADPRIFEVQVDFEEGENGEIEKIFLGEDFYAEKPYYIKSVSCMDASVSAGWRLVPEPATATLSLLALAALAARRRRSSHR